MPALFAGSSETGSHPAQLSHSKIETGSLAQLISGFCVLE